MKKLRKILSLIVTAVIVIIVFVLTLLNIFSSNNKISTNVDTSYEIQNYTLNLVVTNENKVKVEEEIIVNFNKIGKHGIYRNIPLENTLTTNENNKTKKVTQSVEIFDLKGNQNAVKTYSNNNVVIRFGSEHSFQPVNEPVKLTKATRQVLECLKIKPDTTIDTMVAEIGITRETVKRVLKTLREKGFIRRIGFDKTGYYEVLKK